MLHVAHSTTLYSLTVVVVAVAAAVGVICLQVLSLALL